MGIEGIPGDAFVASGSTESALGTRTATAKNGVWTACVREVLDGVPDVWMVREDAPTAFTVVATP